MKVIFTTAGQTLDAPLDAHFGRTPKFLVYDMDSGTFEVVDNRETADAAHGAGIQAAQTVARLGASCVVTGNCGPKAFRALSAAGVKIYNTDAPTVSEALDRFRSGTLAAAAAANAEGHWS